MITLIVPANYQISLIQQVLTDELGTAKNIKSKANRDSVIDAIKSVQEKLKTFKNNAPENGLCIFCGKTETENGNTKMINYQIIPAKPVYKKLYMCDDHFHLDIISDIYRQTEMFGFIIVDGGGSLYALVSDNNITVKFSFEVDLPKKHNKGGQSAVRFERLRQESITNYIRKACEYANNIFIDSETNLVNVKGIIIAGSAEMKNHFMTSNILDPRIKTKICGVFDVQYGGRAGLNSAIDQSKDLLKDLGLIKEKNIISEFFDHLNKDTGKYIFGINETINQLIAGTVEKLILYQDLKIIRCEADEIITYTDCDINQNINQILLTDWIIEHYREFSTKLYLISDQTQEGMQFIKGFGGLAAILRYKIDDMIYDNDDNNDAYL